MKHFCPMCGIEHGDEDHEEVAEEVVEDVPHETSEEPDGAPTDNEVTIAAIEALENVAEAAIMADMVSDLAEEETDQVEAVTDAIEQVAEEESEIAIAEGGDGTPEPETPEGTPDEELVEEDAPTGEPEKVEPPARDDDGDPHSEHRARAQSAFSRRHRR